MPIWFFINNNPNLPAYGDFSQYCLSGTGACGSWECDGNYLIINDRPLPNGILKMQEYFRTAGVVEHPNLFVRFESRDSIVMSSGFEVKLAAIYEAVIEDCGN